MKGIYDLNLVALSIGVGCIAAYTALDLLAHMRMARGRAFWFWLGGGSLAMGSGIWSMHFIGMLAFHLPVSVGYNMPLTVLSLAVAISISAIALWLMRFQSLKKSFLVSASAAAGIGIVAMHYTGMSAMGMSPSIDYDPKLVLLSVAVAMLAAYTALHAAFAQHSKRSFQAIFYKLISTLALGGAISGMHYTAMEAAHFVPGSVSINVETIALSNTALAAIVAFVTFLILALTLITSAFDAHFSMENAKLAASLQAANDQLRAIALLDALTGLPGRLLFQDRLNQALYRAERNQKSFACLFIDLDKFKPVNDTFGHAVGDELLKKVAERLQVCIRKGDTVARLGGDEFVIILNDIETQNAAEAIAAKINDAINRTFIIEGHELTISCSIGVSIFPNHGFTPESLLAEADKAMYAVKRQKKPVARS